MKKSQAWEAEQKKQKEIGESITSKLYRCYGEKVAIRNGNSLHYSFNDINREKLAIVDIVIYLDYQLKIAIMWDNQYRRKMKADSHCFNWKQDIDKDKIASGQIDEGYRAFFTSEGKTYEKVLIMTFETLLKNVDYLYDLVCWDETDENILGHVAEEMECCYNRGRRTVSRWNRDCKFRNAVLEVFDRQCAICRCTEEKILEAAHIVAVEDGGNDDVNNGICLCANHHKMFDGKLIQIDFKSMTLSYISDTVKEMPWYNAYLQNGCRLVKRKEN